MAYDPAEPRDAHGRWTRLGRVLAGHNVKGLGTNPGTAAQPINTHGDVMLAARLIAQGKHVRLNKVDQVGTLLKDLARLSAEAKQKHETLDLCRVSVPKTNLFCAHNKGLHRIQMPQLAGIPRPGSKAAALGKPGQEVDLTDEFEKTLRAHGVKVTDTTLPAASFKATQDQLVGDKVAGIEKFMETAPKDSPVFEPIFVTRDHYIIDGHHRWAAMVALDAKDGVLGNLPMRVRMVDMEIGEALAAANAFAKDWGIASEGATNTTPAVAKFALASHRVKSLDLAFNPDEKRDSHGRWTKVLSDLNDAVSDYEMAQAFGGSGKEGDRVAQIVKDNPGLKDHPKARALLKDHPELSGWKPTYASVSRDSDWKEVDSEGGFPKDHDSIHMEHQAQIDGQFWDASVTPDTTKEEHYARSVWTSYQAPDQYQSINTMLRTGKKTPDSNISPEQLRHYVDVMFKEGGYTLPKPMTLYRAIRSSNEPGHNWAENFKPGSDFTDNGIMSCTAHGKFAQGWLNLDPQGTETDREKPDDVVLEIKVPAGQRVVGGTVEFIETMLPPGTRLKIISSEKRTAESPANPLGGLPEAPFVYTHVVAEVQP